MVGHRELDVEGVGDQPAVSRQNLRRVVDLALESGGYLDRLHSALKGAGEGSGDDLLKSVL